MMRRMGMLLAVTALAACGGADTDDARPAAPAVAAADSAPVRPATADAVPAADSGAGKGVHIHPTLPPHAFALHGGEPGVVDSIVVTAGGRRVQTLRPRENLVPPDARLERVSTIDLDFDGYADLALLSTLGMANSRSEYWRFDPRMRRFVPAGEFETLAPDSAAREHTTFNRGGHAGRLWTAARHRWVDGRLLTVAEEEQALHEDGERYVRIVRRRQDGKMVEAGRTTLEDADLRAGPSWMEP